MVKCSVCVCVCVKTDNISNFQYEKKSTLKSILVKI